MKPSLLKTLEIRRLELQARLDSEKTQLERNKLGQFATPSSLADEILKCGLELMGENTSIRFLDPAIGTGAFYSALLKNVSNKELGSAYGFEIDRHYGKPSQQLWADSGLNLVLGDFTRHHVPTSERDLFNLIICNPPYVRHHHLNRDDKGRLTKDTLKSAGIRLSGLAGLYCYFLLLSHRWMVSNGLAVWLIPSEFMDVNYGKALKMYLMNKVTLLRIHRFNPEDVQFDDALVTSAVVMFRKALPREEHVVEFTYGGSLLKPKKSRPIPLSKLDAAAKWSSIPNGGLHKDNQSDSVGNFFDIKRGIATGANKFFILSEERVNELNLPRQFLKPILPGPRFVPGDEIRADKDGHPMVEPRLLVLDCNLPEGEIQKRFPSLWKYLLQGKEEAATSYLCQHRTLWYTQEIRQPAPILCTYIGRGDRLDGKPFRFILNHSKALATNVYLMMYPKEALRNEFSNNPDAQKKVLALLNGISGTALKRGGRVYGGGVHKLEPKELQKLPVRGLAGLLDGSKDSQNQDKG